MNLFRKITLQTAAALMLLSPSTGTLLTGPAPAYAASSAVQTPSIQYFLENAPIKRQGILYYPLKDIAPLLDLHVQWNKQTRSIEVTGITQTAKLTLGSIKASVKGGKTVSLGAAVFVNKGVAYAPASLFSKAFSIPVTLYNLKKKVISAAYQSHYVLASAGNSLFWLSRPDGVLYAGTSGQVPVRIGAIGGTEFDWVALSVQPTAKNTYLIHIDNAHGEPHINQDLYTIILHEGKIVRQAVMRYSIMFSDGYMYDNVKTFSGQIVLNDGHHLDLTTGAGDLVQSYNLDKIAGTTKEIYSVEAIGPEFFIMRQFSTGNPMIVNRKTLEAVSLYDLLFDPETAGKIKNRDADYYNYRLKYTGCSGAVLHFTWAENSSSDSKITELEYKLSF
ncbi:copper amine oxidase N-terminal domain-containing protein [Paenibacillus caui]|uniref:copper amine oxidase N-terminal domain-containing protein n=1 Tax=Paenibacillus caui TaxID=2873927 RepID=UPI001CAA1D65|nr:copper amine oxidase N-terminal domain-containing protein [Paenibacillus caui]